MTQYSIRLDDACPNMNHAKWRQMEALLDKYQIQPLVGIIPQNQDAQTIIDETDNLFWEVVKAWQHKGWTIALHGFNHVCASSSCGINPVHSRSEFAGLPYGQQCEKLQKGIDILHKHDIHPSVFFAPSHTYDLLTIKALINTTPIRILSDSIAQYPYQKDEICFVPCQMGVLREIWIPGIWTACYHPNLMDDAQFDQLERFITTHREEMVSFNQIDTSSTRHFSFVDKCLSTIYYAMRKIKQ